MVKSIHYIYIIACLAVSISAKAQRATPYSRQAATIVEKYKGAMQAASRRATDAVSESAENVTLSPYMYRLIGSGVYYSSAMSDKFRLDYALPESDDRLSETSGSAYRDALNSAISAVLFDTYVNNPNLFNYHDSQIDSENIVSPADIAGVNTDDLESIYDKADEIKDVVEVVDNVDVELHIEKPNFWSKSGKFALQFTQNYFSENWYKGGNNNVTLMSNLVLGLKYDDKRWVQWDNTLDMRLGFVTATSDTCHRYMTNNDKIYFSSKLGVKAAKSWYYTVAVEANTQFMPGYKSNDRKAYSKFLAPLDGYMSIGMDYKPSLPNGNTLAVTLLPLSYKMRYIGVDDETIISAYHMKHHNFQQDFGSKIEVNAKFTIVKGLTWKCRSYYFTSYEYVEAELENVFSFQFNKYISSEIYTLWRFDDNRSHEYYDRNLGFFQFTEYFTLGLSYNF
ncbi:MAG: DUF3078 domain-containing protein [Prevotellaceae bacterium]|nr:DUF3078 domain-containing protein [Prevotellaceae bacterium]